MKLASARPLAAATFFLSTLCAMFFAVRVEAAPERRFVLIVANNFSGTEGLRPLRYADDDGALFYELLAPTAERIALLTVFDQETERLHPELAGRIEAPSRAALLTHLREYNRRMDAARAEGYDPVLDLILVGHGEVTPDGEGFLSLLDGPFRRSDLYRDVITASTASFNHIVIDACNSYLMVGRRGGDDRGPGADAAIHAYLSAEELDRHPNTGVVLSTSHAKASHEWSVFGSGIFSHELRSAMAGGADVNGDGRVEYSEIAAFIGAANIGLDDPEARLDIFVRPPALDRHRALADLGTARYRHFLRIPRGVVGHLHLEDARGLRYADLNKTAESSLLIGLVDSPFYFLRDDERELSIPLGPPGAIDLEADAMHPRSLALRGAVEESFQKHLFEVPFGPGFYNGYVASAGFMTVNPKPPTQLAPPTAGARDTSLLPAAQAVADRVAAVGFREGDDLFLDHLVGWALGRAKAGDTLEARRAFAAIEARLAETFVDGPVVERKLRHAKAALQDRSSEFREPLNQDLAEARYLLHQGEVGRANELTNKVLDAVARHRHGDHLRARSSEGLRAAP